MIRPLAELSWDEAESAFQADPLLIWPLGAQLKEHGWHLPLNNDATLASALLDRLQDDPAGRARWSLPLLGWSFFPAFLDYPGSVSLSRETSRALILETARCFARHGARRLYILNTGISTLPILREAQRELEPEMRLGYLNLHEALSAAPEGLLKQARGSHADEGETSMMMVLRPESVRLERAQPELAEDAPGPLRRRPGEGGLVSESGAWGDPCQASVEKGEVLIELILATIRRDLQSLEDWSFSSM